MTLFLAYVADMYAEFDPAIHCNHESAGFSFSMTQGIGQVAQILVERPQIGWAIMHPDHPRFVIASDSPTGDPADAVVIARGRIAGLPGDLFQRTQTITILCAPENLADIADPVTGKVDGPIMAFARALPNDGIVTNFLLDDADPDRPETYLLGRTAAFYIDPATHEISLSDLVTGERIIDLEDWHFHDNVGVPEAVFEEPPVPRARMKIKAAWTQEAAGYCNIATRIRLAAHRQSQLHTLSPDFLQYAGTDFPGGVSSMIRGNGWTLIENMSRVRVREGKTMPTFSGRVLEVTYNSRWTAENQIEASENGLTSPSYFPNKTKNFSEMISFAEFRHDFDNVWMEYDYHQDREEEIYLVLDQAIQGVPSVESEIDEDEVGLVTLTEDLTAVPYERGDWSAGDRVVNNGRIYVCNEGHFSDRFYMPKPSTLPPGMWEQPDATKNLHPYWDEVASSAPLRRSASEFAGLEVGKKVIAHCMLRLRKALLLRNQSLRVTATYPWDVAVGITLKDSIRMLVPWHDGSARALVGKVAEFEKSYGDFGPTVTLTIAVSLGTGEAGETEATLESPFNRDGYFPDGYMAPVSEIDGVEDIEFIVDADRISRPIDASRLASPFYTVASAKVTDDSAVQLSAAFLAGQYGLDPGAAVQAKPTRLEVEMIDLSTEGVIHRDVFVAGELLTSPRGIDLVNGEEP